VEQENQGKTMEDILLADIEKLKLDSNVEVESSQFVTSKNINDDSASESNDEFDEIMNRDVLKLNLREMHGAIPGSSPRLSSREIAQSPFYSEDEDQGKLHNHRFIVRMKTLTSALQGEDLLL